MKRGFEILVVLLAVSVLGCTDRKPDARGQVIVPDNKHRLAVFALRGERTVVIVDGQESAGWDSPVSTEFAFRDDGVLEYLAIRDNAVYRVRHFPASPTAAAAAKPAPAGTGEKPREIVAHPSANAIFSKAPGNKSRPASARVQIPDGVSVAKARVSGDGHNQDRDRLARNLEVKINGQAFKVASFIVSGRAKSFDMSVPPGMLVIGGNDIQPYND